MTEVVELTTDHERKADFTLLAIMEDALDGEEYNAKKVLEFFGISQGEYRRLVRKYRYVLRHYRTQRGTYLGEFEDVPRDLSQADIQRAHELFNEIMEKIQKG